MFSTVNNSSRLMTGSALSVSLSQSLAKYNNLSDMILFDLDFV